MLLQSLWYLHSVFFLLFQRTTVSSACINSEKDKEKCQKYLPSDEALEEVNKHMKEAFDILKRETNNLRKERKAFDEVAKKLKHVHFSEMLKLNVGGHIFATSLATMNKDPGTFTCNYLLN